MFGKVRLWLAGAILTATIGFVSMTTSSFAMGDKDLRPDVVKIADLFKKGDAAAAKKAAGPLGKEFKELGDLMNMFRTRKAAEGLGWGLKTPAGVPDEEDGHDKKIKLLIKANADDAAKHPGNTEEAGFALAALAELILAKTPDKFDDSKIKERTKKNWTDRSEEMRAASLELAAAGKSKNGDAIIKSAKKVYGACNKCHDVFKD